MSKPNRREMLHGTVATVGGLVAASVAAHSLQAAEEKKPTFRFPMEAQKGRVDEAGSAKEATALQFPISKGLAGVSMRLKPGGLRELHWHANAAEWAYMIGGRARVTVFDPDGRWEVLDFGPGDVWYFPRGHGHSIQGLGPDECHFILVFDNGYFSEFATFSITDWAAHTPPSVLAQNLNIPVAEVAKFPKKEVYFAKGPVPPALPAQPPAGSQKTSPLTHRYRLVAQEPRTYPGGSIRLVSSREFPISTNMTGAVMTIKPGALREMHWHPNADEWLYFISGKARMTIFESSGRAETDDFSPGDVGYAPQGNGHYIENIGKDECQVLIVFNSGVYQEISISEWLAANPRQLVAANFGIPEDLVARFPTKRQFFVPKGKG